MSPKDDETVTMEVPWAPGRTVTGRGEQVRRFIAEGERQRLAATMSPQGNCQQMTALARLFPTMSRYKGDRGDTGSWIEPVPGTDPWDPEKLIDWLNTSGEVTGGSRHAALFLLSVWNADDWCVHGLKVRKLGKDDWKGRRRIGRFDFNDAWAAWDQKHRDAALAWLTNPFWP